jgi:hypothetical protein
MAADGFVLDPVEIDGKLVDCRIYDCGMTSRSYTQSEGVRITVVKRQRSKTWGRRLRQARRWQKAVSAGRFI